MDGRIGLSAKCWERPFGGGQDGPGRSRGKAILSSGSRLCKGTEAGNSMVGFSKVVME